VALREVHLLLLAGHHLDDGVRDVLLGVGRRALGTRLVVEDDRPVLLDSRGLGLRGLLVRIDVLHGHPLARVFVLLHPVLEAQELAFLREHLDIERRVQLGQHAPRLVREAELLARRQIPALVLFGADVVERDQDAEHDEHAGARERAVAGLPPAEDLRDLPPLPDRVDQHDGQAAPRQVVRVLLLGRETEADHHGREHQRRADPADETEDAIHHGR